MNELLDKVTAETGPSQDQAQAVVNSMLGLLNERLPAPIASGLESLPNPGEATQEASGGLAGRAAAAIGGLFGSKS